MRATRRRFLQGTGGIVFSLPWLEKLAGRAEAAAPGRVPRRLIVVAYPMGVPMAQWQPSAQGTTFQLPYTTLALEPFKARSLFVSNLDNAAMHLNRQHAFGHPGKKESALTGTLLTGAFGGDGSNRVANVVADLAGSDTGGPNNESVCNFIGSRIRTPQHLRPSVDLAVNGEPNRTENNIDATFFFESRANPVSLQANPARAFYELFTPLQQDVQAQMALRELRVRNRSVLDAVRAEFSALRSGLGIRDRTRLDDHAAKIRQIEIDIGARMCSIPTGIPGLNGAQAPYTPFLGMSMAALAPLQLDILAQSMACEIAPVGRLEFIHQQSPLFGVGTTDQMQRDWNTLAEGNGWHSMVHGDIFPGDNLPTRPNQEFPNQWAEPLLDGYRFFVDQFAALLSRLDAIPEGPDGTVLDNSLVALVTDFGNGNGHSANKMGYLFSGNTGCARSGYHLDCAPGVNFYTDSSYNTNQLLVSLIRMFELTDAQGGLVNSFGLEGFSTGVIDALFT